METVQGNREMIKSIQAEISRLRLIQKLIGSPAKAYEQLDLLLQPPLRGWSYRAVISRRAKLVSVIEDLTGYGDYNGLVPILIEHVDAFDGWIDMYWMMSSGEPVELEPINEEGEES